MSEPDPATENGAGENSRIQTPEVTRKKKSRISWIWLVPIVAAIAGISLVARTWLEKGPTVTLTFNTAEGLEVGKTQVRYKDVNIGTVHSISLSEDRSKVIVKAEMAKEAASLAREGTRFWVVRPRLGLSGVSGLGTLLSGAYIGVDAPVAKVVDGKTVEPEARTDFVGLETPPEVTHDRPGKRFTLRADTLGSLDVGSPVYYRRISVGQVIGYQLDNTGHNVNVQVFVDAPYDKYVTGNTHFWNASGVDFTVNADGLKLRTQSLLSVAVGGIAFEDVNTANAASAKAPAPAAVAAAATAQPAKADTSFTLYAGEGPAKASDDGDPFPIRLRFYQSIRGLSLGAPIDFNGIVMGQVESIDMDFDTQNKQFFAVVRSTLYPQRLGAVFEKVRNYSEKMGAETPGHPAGRLLQSLVERGLRAQLRTSNLLTGQLYVALDVFPKAPRVEFQLGDPTDIPTTPGNLDQLQQQITSIVTKIDSIPFDKIGADLRTSLEGASRLMNRLDKQVAPEAQAMLRQANKSLMDISNLLAPDAALPTNSQRAMEELARAARSLRALSDYLQANPEALLRGRGPDPIPGRNPIRN
jgi:paraquat-inducible protein B